MMIRLLAILSILLCSSLLLAQEHGSGHGAPHEGGIPPVVFHQAVNFVLFAVLLFIFLRKMIAGTFKTRHESFHSALTKAQAAKKDAESRKQEIQDRLNRLESTAAESLQTARQEAEALRKKILAEAEELSQHVRTEATRTAEFEIQRAKTELREELLAQSVAQAKKILSEKTSEADQKRLQSEFVEKIQAGR